MWQRRRWDLMRKAFLALAAQAKVPHFALGIAMGASRAATRFNIRETPANPLSSISGFHLTARKRTQTANWAPVSIGHVYEEALASTTHNKSGRPCKCHRPVFELNNPIDRVPRNVVRILHAIGVYMTSQSNSPASDPGSGFGLAQAIVLK